jgi:uncharacterized protein YqjF (DUF2071 family)
MPFLTARWHNLLHITWRVPPALLIDHVPPGVELDIQQGQAFVSLVAFDFLDTRVLGVPWPGYRDFPELNLRFYVKRGEERGVVFIREFVPKRLVASMARLTYNEPYVAAPMSSSFREDDALTQFELTVDYGGRRHRIGVSATGPLWTPAEDSMEHYFKEHKWGFGRDRNGQGVIYEVTHPVWDIWHVQSTALDVDFGLLYGPQWSFLAEAKPHLTVFAKGSAISVHPKGKLKT